MLGGLLCFPRRQGASALDLSMCASARLPFAMLAGLLWGAFWLREHEQAF